MTPEFNSQQNSSFRCIMMSSVRSLRMHCTKYMRYMSDICQYGITQSHRFRIAVQVLPPQQLVSPASMLSSSGMTLSGLWICGISIGIGISGGSLKMNTHHHEIHLNLRSLSKLACRLALPHGISRM